MRAKLSFRITPTYPAKAQCSLLDFWKTPYKSVVVPQQLASVYLMHLGVKFTSNAQFLADKIILFLSFFAYRSKRAVSSAFSLALFIVSNTRVKYVR